VGERTIKTAVFIMPPKTSTAVPPPYQTRAYEATDEGMGRTAGQPEIPGDDVPGNGPSQGREDDSVFNNGGVDDAGTNSMGNLYAYQKGSHEVEESCPDDGILR